MLARNDVINWNDKTWRILAMDLGSHRAALIDIKATDSKIKVVSFEELLGAYRVDDPFAGLRDWWVNTERQGEAEKAYETIRPIILKPALLFDQPTLKESVLTLSKGNDKLRRQIRRWLSRFWRRGQTIFALQSERGTNSTKKTYTSARPGPRSTKQVAVTEEIKKLFDEVCKQKLLKHPPLSVPQAYSCFLQLWLAESGRTVDNAPTLRQFRYFFTRNYPAQKRRRAAAGDIAYNKDVRQLRGTVFNIVPGIGYIYEIDSTVADINLVSAIDRNKIVGRPILYVVTDVFSGMITGVWTTFENAQFIVAADALFAAISPKGELLKRFGIESIAEDWPVAGVPAAIAADNAELKSETRMRSLIAGGVNADFTAPYRGDAKGTVERLIGLVQNELGRFVTGKPAKTTVRKAGGKDARLDASATLDDYMRMVMKVVLHLNKTRVRENRPPMYPSDMPNTPQAVWNWAARSGKSALQNLSDLTKIRRALLVHKTATLSKRGISVNGFKYGGEQSEDAGWQLRRYNADRPAKVDIAFDPADISEIYLTPTAARREWWKCRLIGDSTRFAGMGLFEAQKIREEEKASDARAEDAFYSDKARLNVELTAESQKIQKQTIEADKGIAPRAKIRGIAENRREERIARTQKRMDDASEQAISSAAKNSTEKVSRENYTRIDVPQTLYEMPD